MLELNKLIEANGNNLIGISGIPLVKIDFSNFYQNNYNYLDRKLKHDRYLGNKMLFYLNSRGNLVVRNDNFEFACSSCVGVYEAKRDTTNNMLKNYLNVLRIAMNKELAMSKNELFDYANHIHNDLFLFKPNDFANWLFINLAEIAPIISSYSRHFYLSYLVDCDPQLAFKFVKKVCRSKNMQAIISDNYKLDNMLSNTVLESAGKDPTHIAQYLDFVFQNEKLNQNQYKTYHK